MSRNGREGNYCGKTTRCEAGSRSHVRSKHCGGHPPSSGSAVLELRARLLRLASAHGLLEKAAFLRP